MLNFGNKEFRNLQEQVLQNARDIATLKGRENLQIVIVEELPETGNPNYIYLVPNEDGETSNLYEEYIWLADSEEYEKIGSVDIDLTNYVTTDTEQTISGKKTFSDVISFGGAKISYDANYFSVVQTSNSATIFYANSSAFNSRTVIPVANSAYDLGSSSKNWKDLYLSGSVDFGNSATITKDSSNRINLCYNNIATFILGGANGYGYVKYNFCPDGSMDLGRSSYLWKDLYLSGNITDGVNSITVANIASKVVASYASGTFDANGESTIDISDGTPEGLFIFTYGNCQCFVRLTATMVQNADVTPIRVACPMIYNSNPASGWLNISRSSDTLTISVIDGTNHVDSGYAWTLVKTSLI